MDPWHWSLVGCTETWSRLTWDEVQDHRYKALAFHHSCHTPPQVVLSRLSKSFAVPSTYSTSSEQTCRGSRADFDTSSPVSFPFATPQPNL